MNRFGPSRGELWFRFLASLAGLAVLAVALSVRGFPTGIAVFEVVLIAGGFFGGSAVWSGWRLWRGVS